MSKLDTTKVWESLMKDPGFTAGLPAEAPPIFKELIEAIPDVMSSHLGKKVTLKSMMESTLALVEYQIESGFPTKMISAIPEDQRPFEGAEMAAMVVDALKMLRSPIMEAINDPAGFLAMQGIDERTFLGHPQGGRLDARSLAAYDARTLTIQGLLETQPAVFIQLGQG